MKKILLLLLSMSSIVYSMEDLELQTSEAFNSPLEISEAFNSPLEISAERAKQLRTDLVSVSSSKSAEVIEKLEEMEAEGSKTPPIKRRAATTLTKEEIDETKKQKEPTNIIINLGEVKKQKERTHSITINLQGIDDVSDEEVTKNYLRIKFGERLASKKVII